MTPAQPPVARAILDLHLGAPDGTRAPSDTDVRTIERMGGRVIHRFHIDAIRAELDTGAVRALVYGPDAIVEMAEQVLDLDDLTISVQIGYRRPVTSADSEQIARLGGVSGVTPGPRPILHAVVSDSALPALIGASGVEYVRARTPRCGRAG